MVPNRWLGLALVGLLALMAQPVAVTDTASPSAASEDDQARQGCTLPVDGERLAEELDAADDVVPVDADACQATGSLHEVTGELDRAVDLLG